MCALSPFFSLKKNREVGAFQLAEPRGVQAVRIEQVDEVVEDVLPGAFGKGLGKGAVKFPAGISLRVYPGRFAGPADLFVYLRENKVVERGNPRVRLQGVESPFSQSPVPVDKFRERIAVERVDGLGVVRLGIIFATGKPPAFFEERVHVPVGFPGEKVQIHRREKLVPRKLEDVRHRVEPGIVSVGKVAGCGPETFRKPDGKSGVRLQMESRA